MYLSEWVVEMECMEPARGRQCAVEYSGNGSAEHFGSAITEIISCH